MSPLDPFFSSAAQFRDKYRPEMLLPRKLSEHRFRMALCRIFQSLSRADAAQRAARYRELFHVSASELEQINQLAAQGPGLPADKRQIVVEDSQKSESASRSAIEFAEHESAVKP